MILNLLSFISSSALPPRLAAAHPLLAPSLHSVSPAAVPLAILILGRDVALSLSAFYYRYISLPGPVSPVFLVRGGAF